MVLKQMSKQKQPKKGAPAKKSTAPEVKYDLALDDESKTDAALNAYIKVKNEEEHAYDVTKQNLAGVLPKGAIVASLKPEWGGKPPPPGWRKEYHSKGGGYGFVKVKTKGGAGTMAHHWQSGWIYIPQRSLAGVADSRKEELVTKLAKLQRDAQDLSGVYNKRIEDLRSTLFKGKEWVELQQDQEKLNQELKKMCDDWYDMNTSAKEEEASHSVLEASRRAEIRHLQDAMARLGIASGDLLPPPPCTTQPIPGATEPMKELTNMLIETDGGETDAGDPPGETDAE